MRLSLVTDAWHPQVNGVVTTWTAVVARLRELGHTVDVIEPGAYATVPCPGYPEIRLAWPRGVGRRLRAFAPDRVHVATEGPLGWAAIRFLRRRGWRHTTSFHTRFPEYVRARLPFVSLASGYALLRRFHCHAAATLVPTPSMAQTLAQYGFDNLVVWHRGVDTRVFRPDVAGETGLTRPIHLYVGRVAEEKNIAAFLGLSLPGTKVVLGEGPQREQLERSHPEAVFRGYQAPAELAAWYASADVFVFPSRTDTYGVVMLEALACATPVAAYPVTGPADVLTDGVTGALDEDLSRAIERARTLDRAACAAFARGLDWAETTRRFLDATVAVRGRV